MSNDPTPQSHHPDDTAPDAAAETQASTDQLSDEATADASIDSPVDEPTSDSPDSNESETNVPESDGTDFSATNADALDTDTGMEPSELDEADEGLSSDTDAGDGDDRDITAAGSTAENSEEFTDETLDTQEAIATDITTDSASSINTDEAESEALAEDVPDDITNITTTDITDNITDGTDAEAADPIAPDSTVANSTEGNSDWNEESEATSSPDSVPDATPSIPPSVPFTESSMPSPQPSGESGGIFQKVLGTAVPVLRSATVWTLQTSVRGLDWVSGKLESRPPSSEEPSEPLQPQGAVEAIWVAVSPFLAKVILFVSGSLSTAMKWGLQRLDAEIPSVDEQAEPSRFSIIMSSIWERILPILKQIWRLWQRVLAILRNKTLPNALKTQSDLTLTVLAGSLLIGILWLTSAIIPDRQPVPIAQNAPEGAAKTVNGTQSVTADQKRLASIQEQLATVADDFREEMLQSVQIDDGGDRLSVMLGADWYRLNATEQDQLARDLLKRSRNLSFNNLEILDFEGHRVARSPVIGETMIIFERTSEVVAEMDRIAAEEAAAEAAAAAKAVVEDTFPDDTLSSEGAAAEDAISPDDAMSNDVILESATSGALVQDDAIPDSSKSAS